MVDSSMSHDTKPGDSISTDPEGHVRISRVIPLSWIIGAATPILVAAISTYYGQQQTADVVREMRQELRAMSIAISAGAQADIGHTYRLTEMERRISSVESDRKR